MADPSAINIRIELPAGEPSPRLLAVLEDLAQVMVDEGSHDVEGFAAQPGGLSIGAGFPTSKVPLDAPHTGAPIESWWCVRQWTDEGGTNHCTIEWGR